MPVFTDILFIWPLFAAAVLFDILIGEYPTVIHPVAGMGAFIRKGAGLADRTGSGIGRFFGGAAVVLSGGVLIYITVWVVETVFFEAAPSPVLKITAGLLMLFIIKSTFSLSALLKAAAGIRKALDHGELKDARRLTATHLVSRDTSALGCDEVSAAVIESVAENFTDSVVAPWFFLFVGGAPAAAVYRFANTCDSMLGYRSEKYEWLGKFAARFDDVLNFIPARLAAFFIVVSAAFRGDCSGRNAGRCMIREHRVTESPNAGWTMAAAAGALGVRLVKTGHYTIDGGKNLPESADIGRTIKLIRTSIITAGVFAAAGTLLISGAFV